MRLLVVEDNEQLAKLLTKGLQTAGYETDVLSSLEEASTVLRTTFYAAVYTENPIRFDDVTESPKLAE